MARDVEFALKTEGLGALNRSLGKINKDLRKNSVRELREIGKKVRTTARPLAPRLTGELAKSYRYKATNKGAAVYSNLPQAGVHEFGGVIAPVGVPIQIKKSRALGRAVQKDAGRIEQQLGDLLDNIARRHGFR